VAHAAAHRSDPYLIFDARYEKVRRGGSVVSQGVLVAIASAPRVIASAGLLGAEQRVGSQLGRGLQWLKSGLRGVSYVVSDDHAAW